LSISAQTPRTDAIAGFFLKQLREFKQEAGMLEGNSQENLGRPSWFSSPLFPILKGVGADAEESRKLGLGQSQLAAHFRNVILGVHMEDPGRLQLASFNLGSFAQAAL
jgi:hypothetical protein